MKRGQYEEMARKAEKEGTAKEVTVTFVKLEKEGEVMVGQLMGVQKVVSKKNNGTYLQYLIETDEGLFKVSFGAAFDREMLPILHIGNVYAFTYLGKRDIGGGHSVNIIKTVLVNESEAGPLLLNYVNENIVEEDPDGH